MTKIKKPGLSPEVEQLNEFVADWNNVPLASIELMYHQVKEWLESIQSEQKDMSDRAFKLFQLFILSLTPLGSYYLKDQLPLSLKPLVVLIYLAVFGSLFFLVLLSPRFFYEKGCLPNDSLLSFINNSSCTNEYRAGLIMYDVISDYRRRIKKATEVFNRLRCIYVAALIITLLSFVVGASLIIEAIAIHLS